MQVSVDLATMSRYGMGCVGSNGRIPRLTRIGVTRLGTKMIIFLRDANDASPAALGFGDVWGPCFAGFDLRPFGAPGCYLYHDWRIFLPAVTNTLGTASIGFDVPNLKSLVGAGVNMQWACLDRRANPMGITTTGRMHAFLGY